MYRSLFLVILVTLALASARSIEELDADGEILVGKRAAADIGPAGDRVREHEGRDVPKLNFHHPTIRSSRYTRLDLIVGWWKFSLGTSRPSCSRTRSPTDLVNKEGHDVCNYMPYTTWRACNCTVVSIHARVWVDLNLKDAQIVQRTSSEKGL
eukprot:sb/3473334/